MPPKFEVLIVDDDALDVYVLERALRRVSGSAARVEVVTNGRDALTLLAEREQHGHLPDVVALDLHMPILDGIGFLTQLRQSERLGGLRTIVLTTTADRKTHDEAMNAGADGIVVKPQTEAAISEVAEYLLNYCQTSMGDHHVATAVGSFGPYGF